MRWVKKAGDDVGVDVGENIGEARMGMEEEVVVVRRQAKQVMRGVHLACWHRCHLFSCSPFGFGQLLLVVWGCSCIRRG